jgi:hypothetical protein
VKDEDIYKQASWTTHEGKSTGRGKPFNPTEDDSCDSSAEADDSRSVPIGRPLSSHDYNRLKERAGNEAPLSGGTAQEDPRDKSATNEGENNA